MNNTLRSRVLAESPRATEPLADDAAQHATRINVDAIPIMLISCNTAAAKLYGEDACGWSLQWDRLAALR